MTQQCDECHNKVTKENPLTSVQYLSGDYDDSCLQCVRRKVDEGLIVRLTSDYHVGHGRMYYKGFVGVGVLQHIRDVFSEMRVAS
jgi:hypothetical protein